MTFDASCEFQNNVTADPANAWVGYMTVFNLNADGTAGDYMFGSGWGVADLKTTLNVDTPNIVLEPNFNTYADNIGDAYWDNGEGYGNKFMEATTQVESTETYNGADLTFTGSVYENTLIDGYNAVYFIKCLDPDAGYSDMLEGAYVFPIEAGEFSVTVDGSMLPEGKLVQFGFTVYGPNANAENVAKQFGATSENQVNMFLKSQADAMEQFNALQNNAMAQFNATEANRLNAQDEANSMSAAQFNTQIVAQVDEFNAGIENQRDIWNVANIQAIEQANMDWRRKANTADTATTNAANAANVQNSYNISTQELDFIWNMMRDDASFLKKEALDMANQETNMYITAMNNDSNTSINTTGVATGVVTLIDNIFE
jgi:hypothetical protein